MPKIVALDIATKSGIAILDNDEMVVYYIEGSPVFQIEEIMKVLEPGTIILVEDFSYFSSINPKTTANLNQRFGYIYWRLVEANYDVHKCNVNSVRKHLKISSRVKGEVKKQVCDEMRMVCQIPFSTDESDAIALILFYKAMEIEDLKGLKVSKAKRKRNVQKR